jgi:hypothetical protein
MVSILLVTHGLAYGQLDLIPDLNTEPSPDETRVVSSLVGALIITAQEVIRPHQGREEDTRELVIPDQKGPLHSRTSSCDGLLKALQGH